MVNASTFPNASILISTYNRADYLGKVLDHLQTQTSSEISEIVVVDNNSSDQTRAVVEARQPNSKFPLHYVFEKRQGLSFARNRAVQESKGDIVLFIDDDALADSNWAKQILQIYRNHPDAVCVGGKVLLEWSDIQRPSWLTQYFIHSLSYFELPYQEEVALSDPEEFMIGCNISFRRKNFLDAGGFDPELGRKGNSLQEGEEKQLQKVLMPKGKIFYNPRAIVHHFVFPHQAKKSFYYRFYWGKAITTAKNNIDQFQSGFFRSFFHHLIRIPVWLLRTLKHMTKPDLRFYCWLQTLMNFRAAIYCVLRT